MKILLTSDWHLHNWKNFGVDHASGMSKRLREQRDVVDQIYRICVQKNVKLVHFNGDLFHKVGEIPVEALNVAYEFFQNLKGASIDWYSTDGNHDLVKRDSPEWFHSSVAMFKCSNLNGTMLFCGDASGEDYIQLSGSGARIKIVDWQDEVDASKISGFDIVLLHKLPYGSIVGKYKFEDGVDATELAQNNRFVFFGHVHQCQQLKPNAYVIGSPMHLTFGDEGDRGVWILDTETWDIEFIKLKYPEFLTVDDKRKIAEDGNYYRLTGSNEKFDSENVISIMEPTYFDERIKSTNLEGILDEWLVINQKDRSWIEPISSILKTKTVLGRDVFKGRLVNVSASDFMSIGQISYSIKNGFILVTGEGNKTERGFNSNGSGKTTVVGESVYWCLFGKTSKGLKGDDVIRNRPQKQKDCTVVVTIKDDTRVIQVTRSRKKGLTFDIRNNEGKIVYSGEGKKQDELQSELESILGFDDTVFKASCYFSQVDVVMLTGLSEDSRTNMITSLLGFESYDDFLVQIKDLKKKGSEELSYLEQKKREAEQSKASMTLLISTETNAIKSEEQEEQSFKNQIYDLETKKKELIISRDSAISSGLTNTKSDIDQLTALLVESDAKYRSFDGQIDDVRKRMQNESFTIQDLERKKAQTISYRSQVQKDIDRLTGDINRLKSLPFGERCDKCASPISHDHVDTFTSEKYSEIDLLKKALDGHNNDEKLLNDDIAIHKNVVNALLNEESTIRRSKEEADKRSMEMKSKIDELKRLEKVYEDSKRQIDNQITQVETRIQTFVDSISRSQVKASAIKKRIDTYLLNQSEAEKKLINLEADRVSLVDKTEKLTFWESSFSNRGIRTLLLDRFCNEFNRIVNVYLSKISSGIMSVVMSPTKQLKSGEERNRLDLLISMGAYEAKYEALSGGEQRRVDVSLCLAMNRWISQKYGAPNGLLGIIILDEIFSFLDTTGEEEIADVLYKEGQEKSVFVISHTPQLASYASQIWRVYKENDVTTLEVSSPAYENVLV